MPRLTPEMTQLADLYGIQTSYVDMRRRLQAAAPESVLFVLKALGAPVEKPADARDALRHRLDELRKRAVEPVLVAWDGIIRKRQLPKGPNGALRLESGEEGRMGGRLPFGYHTLYAGDGSESLIISAPRKAHFPEGKHWGLFVPVYALRSRGSPGAGDLRDLQSLLRWMREHGGTVAGTLPLLASFLDRPFEPSPYAPASRLFWNEFYADVGDRAGGRPSSLVSYRKEMARKRAIIEEQARHFFANETGERRSRFDRFVRASGNLEDYARFRAVTERLRKGWRAWPSRLRDGEIRKGDYDEDVMRYHLYAQWLMQEQLQSITNEAKAAGQMLYLDLPLGLHPDSYDVWRDPEIFVRTAAGGAPPDLVFTKGQNWGFPPLHPEAMRFHHHRYTIAYIRNHLRHAALLRIDHVMGLHRLYWIPDGAGSDQGVFVEYPAEELYAILSIESHRNHAGIIGENLGTVPPEVNRAMSRHNIQQMYVVQYEIVDNAARDTLRRVPARSIASINTHDMPPFQAFLDGADIDDRLALGFLSPKAARAERRRRVQLKDALIEFLKKTRFVESGVRNPKSEIVFQAVMNFLAASAANIVLVNMEDLWQEVLPQNIPATHKECPNWRRRIRHSIEEAQQMTAVLEVLRNVSAHRSRSVPV